MTLNGVMTADPSISEAAELRVKWVKYSKLLNGFVFVTSCRFGVIRNCLVPCNLWVTCSMPVTTKLVLKSVRAYAKVNPAVYHKANNDWKRDISQRSAMRSRQTDAMAAARQQHAGEQIQRQRPSQRAIDDEL